MLKQFMEHLDNVGWDYAIEKLDDVCEDTKVKEVINDYWLGYKTSDYQRTLDPDDGLCFMIRQQAIRQLINILEYKEIMEG